MDITPLPALSDNYIWALTDPTTKLTVLVDPGEADPAIAFLTANQYQLAGILITHHHGDHTNGIEGLLAYAGAIPVFGSDLSPNEFITHRVKDGDTFTCAHFSGRVLAIPGHTLDHTAYYSENDGIVFTGDTLFSAGCGRIFEGTPAMMFDSLNKIIALPDITKVYCGHEYTRANLQFAQAVEPTNQDVKLKLVKLEGCTLPSTIGEEKLINPFLRFAKPEVKQAAESYAAKKLADDVAVFATIREWKNNFKL
jgi:hydroxyacylglutathione hydrolase